MNFHVNIGCRSRTFLFAFRTIDWSIREDPPISSAINLALHLRPVGVYKEYTARCRLTVWYQ